MAEKKYEVMVEDGHLVITDDVALLLSRARMLDATIKSLSKERDSIIEAMKDAMNKNGIDKFESDFMRINRSKTTMKDAVNVEKMKADGIYDKYVYHVPSGGSLTATFPKEKK